MIDLALSHIPHKLLGNSTGSASKHTKYSSASHTSTVPALIQAAIIQILGYSKGLLTCLLAFTFGRLYPIPNTPAKCY